MQDTFDYFQTMQKHIENSAQIKIRWYWLKVREKFRKRREDLLNKEKNKKKKRGYGYGSIKTNSVRNLSKDGKKDGSPSPTKINK